MPNNNRKMYTTSIDRELINEFKVYCALNNLYQNEVIEGLLKELLNKNSKNSKEGVANGNTNK